MCTQSGGPLATTPPAYATTLVGSAATCSPIRRRILAARAVMKGPPGSPPPRPSSSSPAHAQRSPPPVAPSPSCAALAMPGPVYVRGPRQPHPPFLSASPRPRGEPPPARPPFPPRRGARDPRAGLRAGPPTTARALARRLATARPAGHTVLLARIDRKPHPIILPTRSPLSPCLSSCVSHPARSFPHHERAPRYFGTRPLQPRTPL